MRSYQHALKELQRENFELKLTIYDLKNKTTGKLTRMSSNEAASKEYFENESDHQQANGNQLQQSVDKSTYSSNINGQEKGTSTPEIHSQIYCSNNYILKVKFDQESSSRLLSMEGLLSFLRDELSEYRINNLSPQQQNRRPFEYRCILKSNIIRIAQKCHQLALELMEINIQRQYLLERKGRVYPIEL